MKRATAISRRGHWPVHLARRTVTLPYDARYRRRIRLATDCGEPFLLDLPEATVLRDGDGLRLDGQEWIVIRAEPEALVEIDCEDRMEQARVAWHLGNRHLPTQIVAGKLRVRDDPVVRDMLRGLGVRIEALAAPFDPESGAYRWTRDGNGKR